MIERYACNQALAGALRHLLQAHEREWEARRRLTIWRDLRDEPRDDGNADDRVLAHAEQALASAASVTDAAIVELTDRLYDLVTTGTILGDAPTPIPDERAAAIIEEHGETARRIG